MLDHQSESYWQVQISSVTWYLAALLSIRVRALSLLSCVRGSRHRRQTCLMVWSHPELQQEYLFSLHSTQYYIGFSAHPYCFVIFRSNYPITCLMSLPSSISSGTSEFHPSAYRIQTSICRSHGGPPHCSVLSTFWTHVLCPLSTNWWSLWFLLTKRASSWSECLSCPWGDRYLSSELGEVGARICSHLVESCIRVLLNLRRLSCFSNYDLKFSINPETRKAPLCTIGSHFEVYNIQCGAWLTRPLASAIVSEL